MQQLYKALIITVFACSGLLISLPVQAEDIVNSELVRQAVDRKNYEPGQQYFLFGGARGSVTGRTGQISVIPTNNVSLGNLHIQEAIINGQIGYVTKFHNHHWQEHGPFDSSASRSATSDSGSAFDGFTMTRLNWSGRQLHPADGYDGEQGGGFPAPTGARDEYTYTINGHAQSIRFESDDTRDASQRVFDRYANLPSNFSDRANEAHRQMFEHNPNLDKWGNRAEAINGLFSAIFNPVVSAYEALGMGDIVQGVKDGSAIATMHGLEGLSAEGKMAVVDNLVHTAGFTNYATEQTQEWARKHPNNAEAVKMWGNVLQAATGLRAVRGSGIGAVSPTKSVSHNFADAYMHGKSSIPPAVTSTNTSLKHGSFRQTGGGNGTAAADKLYDEIRRSSSDVQKIAQNTGIKPENIQKVKDHVFFDEHRLDRYTDMGIPAETRRFDSDLNQAMAWKRMESGTYSVDDITWLKHETAERWYERKYNSGYSKAHNAAERKWTGNPWEKGNK